MNDWKTYYSLIEEHFSDVILLLFSLSTNEFIKLRLTSDRSRIWVIIFVLQIEDHISPGVVEWKKISKPPIKMEIYKRQNCQYAVTYAKGLKLKIVGIGGDNLFDQSEEDNTLKLGLIWQLMRAYTGKILQSLEKASEDGGGDQQKDIDKSIIEFTNNKVRIELYRQIFTRSFYENRFNSTLV